LSIGERRPHFIFHFLVRGWAIPWLAVPISCGTPAGTVRWTYEEAAGAPSRAAWFTEDMEWDQRRVAAAGRGLCFIAMIPMIRARYYYFSAGAL